MKDLAIGKGTAVIEKYRLSPGDTEESLISRIENGLERPYETLTANNLWLNTGWDELFKLITGISANHFDSQNSRIGVGDNSTAASDSQTDLLATTNKIYKAMDSGFPTAPSSQSIQFKSRFSTPEANFAWREAVVKNSKSGVCWNRLTGSWGTKSATEIWYLTITLGKA